MSPTQRSIALLRKEWDHVEKTEHRVPRVFITRDLFGFCDILCLRSINLLAVQTTSGPHVSERFEKMRNLAVVKDWLCCPFRHIHIHGWAKRGPAGHRKVWTCRVRRLYLTPDGLVEMTEPERAEAA